MCTEREGGGDCGVEVMEDEEAEGDLLWWLKRAVENLLDLKTEVSLVGRAGVALELG